VIIRAAGADDVEALARVMLDARRAAGDRFPPSVHHDDELVPHLLRDVLPVAEAWVAERDGRAVGVLILENDLLDSLYVAPDAQGQGIGSRLLELAKERRPEGLRLWVFVSNEPARALYERHGFVVIGGSDGEANEEGAPDLLLGWTPASG
jgi:ribosomal protein S18 acetylase RimI-like enzyme